MLKLTDGDKAYLKEIEAGTRPSAAFRSAYPDHEAVKFYMLTEKGTPERKKAQEVLADAAKNKLNAKYIKSALMTYQDKMEQFSALSVETAIDLVVNARSEKVRADLAVEGIRHKIGNPVTKMQVQESKTVIITFGEPPSDIIEGEAFIEGEVVSEVDDLDGTDDMLNSDTEPTAPTSSPDDSMPRFASE